MTSFKKFISFAIAIAVISALSFPVSAATFSHEEVRAALESTISKVKASISAVEGGADKETVAELVSDAKQQQKDIENNDLEVKRQHAGKRLNTAWKAARGGDLQLAGESLKEALSRYEEMHNIYVSSH
ncbi:MULTISPECIES: hypothetical protein [Methylomonas]|uniref:Uncharacterized protein n=2 Tax=Methylomonas TaxID=416 RepID=A0A126T8J3_9GAMM|nr:MULTISPECIES: hypothetical protein [Methylomonas]AMK78094.1 hypothetical protein JT25_016670 [Methylomonas denitrificans]OAI07611.1 hypothetical protein A1342_09970 [Methylomonas methanica]TCV85630.1 hypothetical protein EDE11_105192 [Methylomonas methanica]